MNKSSAGYLEHSLTNFSSNDNLRMVFRAEIKPVNTSEADDQVGSFSRVSIQCMSSTWSSILT